MTRRPNVALPSVLFPGAIEIDLTHGKCAIIDVGDYRRIAPYRWYAARAGKKGTWYARGTVNGRTIWLHRFIMRPGRGLDVDHRLGNTLDNRRSQLRVCTRAQNLANRAVGLKSATAIKGVHRHSNGRQFVAYIQKEYKRHYLGTFPTADAARAAYTAASRLLQGEFAREAVSA
jgi:hypothetical protein